MRKQHIIVCPKKTLTSFHWNHWRQSTLSNIVDCSHSNTTGAAVTEVHIVFQTESDVVVSGIGCGSSVPGVEGVVEYRVVSVGEWLLPLQSQSQWRELHHSPSHLPWPLRRSWEEYLRKSQNLKCTDNIMWHLRTNDSQYVRCNCNRSISWLCALDLCLIVFKWSKNFQSIHSHFLVGYRYNSPLYGLRWNIIQVYIKRSIAAPNNFPLYAAFVSAVQRHIITKRNIFRRLTLRHCVGSIVKKSALSVLDKYLILGRKAERLERAPSCRTDDLLSRGIKLAHAY